MQISMPLTLIVSVDDDLGLRRKSARAQLAALGWQFSFVDGFTPQSAEAIAMYDAAQNLRRSKRPLAPAEIATYASHRKAMYEFLKTDEPVALILEDDFCLIEPDSFGFRIATLLQAPVEWDILKLFDFQERRAIEWLPAGDVRIVSHGSPAAGMVGYLITRRGAESILRRRAVYRPIDEDIKFFWELKLRVLSVEPNLIADIGHQLGGSLLEPHRHEIRKARSWLTQANGLAHTVLRKLTYLFYRKHYGLKLKKS